jgi:hypothetical protein
VSKTTQVRLDTETAATLREIAAAFEYFTSRGLEAGALGNTAAMLTHLAEEYRCNPVGTLRALGPLLVQMENRNGE